MDSLLPSFDVDSVSLKTICGPFSHNSVPIAACLLHLVSFVHVTELEGRLLQWPVSWVAPFA